MRVFLCAYEGFSAAIPMSAVSSLFIYNETEPAADINQNTRISLPHLFNLPSVRIRHCLELHGDTEHKIILLSTAVERDVEIPDSQIYPLPRSLNLMRFSAIFNGIHFADIPIFFLNTEQLIHHTHRETVL